MARLITAPGIIKNVNKYLNTMRKVPFSVGVNDWTASGDEFVAEFTSSYVTSSSFEIATYNSSVRTYHSGDIEIEKKSGGGGMILTASKKPTGTISGDLYVFDNNDNKIPVVLEDTVIDLENGGTGASNLSGAQENLGITALETQVETLNSNIATKAYSVSDFFTPATNITVVSATTWAYRTGNIIELQLGLTLPSTAPGSLGTLTTGFRPKSGIQISALNNTDDTPQGNIAIGASGAINCYGLTGGKNYIIHATFVCE